MNISTTTSLIFLLVFSLFSSQSFAQDMVTTKALAQVAADNPPNHRERADQLVINAIKPLINSDYAAADPLLLEAKSIYETLLDQYPTEIKGERDTAKSNSLRTAAFRALDKGDLDGASFFFFFRASYYPYGRDSGNRDMFQRWDADRLAPLALILYKTEDMENASSVFKMIVNSIDSDVRETVISEFSSESFQLKSVGKLLEAKAVIEFAVKQIEQSQASKDEASLDLYNEFSQLLFATQDAQRALQYAKKAKIVAPVESDKFDQDALIKSASALISAGNIDIAVSKIEKYESQSADAVTPNVPDQLVNILQYVPENLLQSRIKGYQKAIRLYSQQSDSKETSSLIAVFGLGDTYFNAGDYVNAEKLYRQAVAITGAHLPPDSGNNLDALTKLANILNILAKPDEAEIYFRRAWDVFSDFEEYALEDIAYQGGNLVSHFLNNGALDKANILSAYILKNARKSGRVEDEDLAQVFAIRANVDLALEDYPAAEKLLRQALKLEPGGIYSEERISAYGNLATVLEVQGKYAQAKPFRQKAFEAATQNIMTRRENRRRLFAGRSLAINMSKGGDALAAAEMFQEILDIANNIHGPNSEITIAIAGSYAEHFFNLGQFEKSYEKSLLAYQGNRYLFDKLGSSVSDEEYLTLASEQSQAAWMVVKSSILSGVDTQAKASVIFEALQRAEMSAAGLALARNSMRTLAENAGSLQEFVEWQGAKQQLSIFDQASASVEGSAKIEQIEADRKPLAKRLEKTRLTLSTKFPEFFDLFKSNPVPLNKLVGKDGLLKENEALILLNPGNVKSDIDGNRGVVFVVSRETWFVANLESDGADISSSIVNLHVALSAKGSGETLADGFEPPSIIYDRAEAFDLYQRLFAIDGVKKVLSTKNHWTIAPQGAFLSLPFSALVSEAPPGGTQGNIDPEVLRATKWLGIEKALSIVPSVKAIDLQRNRKLAISSDREPFFGLGDPAFRGIADPPIVTENNQTRSAQRGVDSPGPAASYISDQKANIAELAKLQRLKGTNSEIRKLADLLEAPPEAVILQMDASEAELKKRSLSGQLQNAEIIVFATHGLLGGENSASIVEPSLALTPPINSSASELLASNDGLLTASEAALLNLNAELVILSACNTASGGIPSAEGLSGLAKAFLYAGAQSLLVSHFPVYDFAAPELTFETLKLQRQRKISSAEAMRLSMAKMLVDESNDENGLSLSHPKAWASFALIDGR